MFLYGHWLFLGTTLADVTRACAVPDNATVSMLLGIVMGPGSLHPSKHLALFDKYLAHVGMDKRFTFDQVRLGV